MKKILSTKDIGEYIKEVRRLQSLTQGDLAGMAGTGVRFIIDVEKGKYTAEIGKVLHVLSVLGISMSASKTWDD